MESHCKSSWPIRLSIRRMFLGSKALRHPSYRAQRGRDIIWNCSGLSHWDGKGELCNYSISLSGLICLAFKLGFFSFFGLVASFLALCWQDSPLCGIRVSHTHTHTQTAPAREAPAARTRRTDDDTDDGEEEEEDYEEDEDDGDNNKRGHRNLKKVTPSASAHEASGFRSGFLGSHLFLRVPLALHSRSSQNKSTVIDCLACANQVSTLSSIQWTCYLLFLNFIWTWLLRSFVHLNRNTSLTRLRTIPFLRCQAGASDFGTEAWCSRPLWIELHRMNQRCLQEQTVQLGPTFCGFGIQHLEPQKVRQVVVQSKGRFTDLPRGWWGSFCQCIPRILAKLMPPGFSEIQTGIQALEAVKICTRLLHPKAAASQTKVLTNSQYKHVVGQPVACSYALLCQFCTDRRWKSCFIT